MSWWCDEAAKLFALVWNIAQLMLFKLFCMSYNHSNVDGFSAECFEPRWRNRNLLTFSMTRLEPFNICKYTTFEKILKRETLFIANWATVYMGALAEISVPTLMIFHRRSLLGGFKTDLRYRGCRLKMSADRVYSLLQEHIYLT